MTPPRFTLISHHLCPYVQRAVIALQELGIPFERRNIDLANKPGWFLKLSPRGKVPILLVYDETALFESSVIAEYVNDIANGSLLLTDPLEKARQRAWIEFASSVIANIGQLYNATSNDAFENARSAPNGEYSRRTLLASSGLADRISPSSMQPLHLLFATSTLSSH